MAGREKPGEEIPMVTLIASLCLHHGAEIITFDADFGAIAKFSPLKVRLLGR